MDTKPTGLDMITEVPGLDKDEKPYVPEQVVDPNRVAIAHELQRRRTEQLEQVSALAVRAAKIAKPSAEQ